MNGQIDMTALQMYLQLQNMGLRSPANVSGNFVMPSAYYYVPTHVSYSTTDHDAEKRAPRSSGKLKG